MCLNQNKRTQKKCENTDANNFVLDEDCDFHSFTKLAPTIEHFYMLGIYHICLELYRIM